MEMIVTFTCSASIFNIKNIVYEVKYYKLVIGHAVGCNCYG